MPLFLFLFFRTSSRQLMYKKEVCVELILIKLAGSSYCLGFFIAFWMIGKKYYRGLRYSSKFWKSAPLRKALAIATAFIMTFVLAVIWMGVVCFYLFKMYLDDRRF